MEISCCAARLYVVKKIGLFGQKNYRPQSATIFCLLIARSCRPDVVLQTQVRNKIVNESRNEGQVCPLFFEFQFTMYLCSH